MTRYKKISPAKAMIYVLVAVTIWAVLATLVGIYGAFFVAAGGGNADIWVNWSFIHFFMAFGSAFAIAAIYNIWSP